MDRRTFVTVATAGALWQGIGAKAQQPSRPPVVGVLLPTALTAGINAQTIVAMKKGLRVQGHVEGQTYLVEVRSADGNPDALPGLAEQLVRLDAAVLCVSLALTIPQSLPLRADEVLQ